MDIARSNGKVVAVGYEGDTRIEQSTINHPFISQTKYDPESETKFDAMLMASTGMLKKIG